MASWLASWYWPEVISILPPYHSPIVVFCLCVVAFYCELAVVEEVERF